jgi:hypothetical protein
MKYDNDMGYQLMELDIIIAGEISERISEQTSQIQNESGSKRAKRAVAKRNQRRERMKTISSEDMGSIMKNFVDSE